MKIMSFIEFRNRMFEQAWFNVNQVLAWQPDFNRNNLTRWMKKGYLIRLRQGYYAFPEYLDKPDYALYFASRIYRPSYISLHTALAFYGMIPESVVQISSITSLKTASFSNEFGQYSYKSMKAALMFGYDLKPMADKRTIPFAKPEKALLDLLYLYPFYNSREEMEDLRLDESYLKDDLNIDLLHTYLSFFKSKALDARVQLLCDAYDL